MVDVLERKDKAEIPPGQTSGIPTSRESSDFLKESASSSESEFDPGKYEGRKHGDVFSGMYFDGIDGVPEWGTHGVLKELPNGFTERQVEDFLVTGAHLELVKKLSPDLSVQQKEKLQHIPGWKRKEQAAEVSATKDREPIVPQVQPDLAQPDKDISYTPVFTEPGNLEVPVAPDNLAGLSAKNIPPGAPLDQLKAMIRKSGSHVGASKLAEELHNQARSTPESKS